MVHRNLLIISVSLLICTTYSFSAKKSENSYELEKNTTLSQANGLNENKKIFISFGESLSKENLAISKLDEYNWAVSGEQISKTGKGTEILNIVFENPGSYSITFTPSSPVHDVHQASCNHANEIKNLELVVLPTKLEFLFDQAIFSTPIRGGVDVQGTLLSIPVVFSSFDNKPTLIENLVIKSAGVNTNIVGELNNKESILNQGVNTLHFALKGMSTVDTYIMFDFYNQDNLIQTYYYPNKINK